MISIMNLDRRLVKLESIRDTEDEVTLEQLVNYSYRCSEHPDPEFEARCARSELCRLFISSLHLPQTKTRDEHTV
jgi:hypothetical protein